MQIPFHKYQGTGNDFIVIDDRQKLFPANDSEKIAQLCHRRFGIGADGLILLQDLPGYDFEMVYFNSDGRTSSMCGNGGRCIAAFAKFLGLVSDEANFLAIDGPHKAWYEDDRVLLEMKNVTDWQDRSGEYVLNTGSPHYIHFTEEVGVLPVVEMAKNIRYNNEFTAEGINVNFVEILGTQSIKVRTYERGVEDETFSCGTGVVASVIAASLKDGNPSEPYELTTAVETLGGPLEVSATFNQAGHFTDIRLIGPAVRVFEGILEI